MIKKHQWVVVLAMSAVVGLAACNPAAQREDAAGEQPGIDLHQGGQRHAQDQRLQPVRRGGSVARRLCRRPAPGRDHRARQDQLRRAEVRRPGRLRQRARPAADGSQRRGHAGRQGADHPAGRVLQRARRHTEPAVLPLDHRRRHLRRQGVRGAAVLPAVGVDRQQASAAEGGSVSRPARHLQAGRDRRAGEEAVRREGREAVGDRLRPRPARLGVPLVHRLRRTDQRRDRQADARRPEQRQGAQLDEAADGRPGRLRPDQELQGLDGRLR